MKQIPLNVRHFGARCDGQTDDSAAINRALAEGKVQGLPVLVPNGVCAYADVLNADSVHLIGLGDGSVLYALDPLRSSIFVRGVGGGVRLLRLTGAPPSERSSDPNCKRVFMTQASEFLVERVTIDTGSGSGIHVNDQSHHGCVRFCSVSNTLADSIHVTDRSHNVLIEANEIDNSGDDGIAVVSYADQGSMCHHITARHNHIKRNAGGRGMSVVGGANILYEHNSIEDVVGAAGLYIAQESSYHTFGAHDVLARFNLIRNCGNKEIGHFAVQILSNGEDTCTDINLVRNIIHSGDYGGIKVHGEEYLQRLFFDSNLNLCDPQTKIPEGTDAELIAYVNGPVGVQV